MNEFYNKHYITTDTQGRITDGWSDGPHPEKDTASALCINEKGSYQFRIFPDGAENPELYTMDGISLYKLDVGKVIIRTNEEIEFDRSNLSSLSIFNEQEKIRADIDFLSIMTGIDIW